MDISASYNTTARRSPGTYFMTAIGLVFLILPLTLDCSRTPNCHDWLRYAAIGLGALFGLGGLAALILKTQCGCRVDLASGELRWWGGRRDRREHAINIADIATIKIDRSGDSNNICLENSAGKRLLFGGSLPLIGTHGLRRCKRVTRISKSSG